MVSKNLYLTLEINISDFRNNLFNRLKEIRKKSLDAKILTEEELVEQTEEIIKYFQQAENTGDIQSISDDMLMTHALRLYYSKHLGLENGKTSKS